MISKTKLILEMAKEKLQKHGRFSVSENIGMNVYWASELCINWGLSCSYSKSSGTYDFTKESK